MQPSPQLPRKAGRPPKNRAANDVLPTISRDFCIARAYELCDTVDLENLSLTMLAKVVGVSPTTIRHHVRSRKDLVPALLKLFFTEICERFPPLTGDWKTDLDGFMMTYMSVKLRKRGFAAYFFEHRFARELDPFTSLPANAVLGRAVQVFRSAGLSTRDAAMAWHLMVHLLSSIAYTSARGLTPADHVAFFESMAHRGERGDDEHTVVAALKFITMPVMYDIICGMLRHAVEVKFEFPEKSAPIAPRPRKARGLTGR